MFQELRPTRIDVDLKALEHNYSVLSAHIAPTRLMPVVKANAYGHGAQECALLFERLGAAGLGVAFLEEGIALRKAGVRIPILAMGGLCGRQLEGFFEYNIDITASSVEKLQRINAVAAADGKRARVHLKIDTGMERIGVHHYHAERLLEAAAAADHCEVVGLFSHFARAEEADLSFCQSQLERFLEVVAHVATYLEERPILHIANSGGILQFPQSALDMVRPGLALYGVYPSAHLRGTLDLRPALQLRSEVVFFKVVEAGAGVSYDHRWVAPRQTRIVTVPIGYGDGYPRRLTNKGEVLIRGKRYPIVGAVCMDQFMVNIDWDEAYNGDEVQLIGRQGNEQITVEEIAELLQTDPREVLCSLQARLPIRYLR